MSEIIVRFLDFPGAPELSTEHTGEGSWLVDVPGWFNSPDVRDSRDPRPNADGEFEQDEVFSEARYPIVVGRTRFADERSLFAARSLFARVMNFRGQHTIEVESPAGARRATVVRNGGLTWDMWRGLNEVEFEMPFKATDARLYGPWKTQSTGLPVAGRGIASPVTSPFSQPGGGSPGRVEMRNAGSTDTIPEATVAGGGMAGGLQLTRVETGERIRLEWPILPTDTVRFSFEDGQVWLNEQSPISGRLTVAEWWTIGPGETATVQFEALGDVTGAPVLTMRWRDADS